MKKSFTAEMRKLLLVIDVALILVILILRCFVCLEVENCGFLDESLRVLVAALAAIGYYYYRKGKG